jgi:hypothetical protein
MLEQWQCSLHRMRTVPRRIYAAHLTACRGILEQLEQVEIDAFPTAFVTESARGNSIWQKQWQPMCRCGPVGGQFPWRVCF